MTDLAPQIALAEPHSSSAAMPHDIVGSRTWMKIVATHAMRAGSRPAVRFEGETYSYIDLVAAAGGLAAALDARGMRKGDVAAIFMDTSLEFPVSLLAAHSLGVVVVPVSTKLSSAELEHQLSHCEARLVIADAAHRDQAQAWCGSHDAGLIDSKELDTLTNIRSELPSVDVGPDDLATIMYTSGTTAHPKGVMLTHGNYVYNSEILKRLYGYGPDDVGMSFFPLFHQNGHNYQLTTWLSAGALVHLLPRFSASRFGQQLVDTGATITSVTAPHVKMILAHPPGPEDAQNALRMVKFAMTLDPARIVAFEDRFQTKLCGTYSQTEAIGPIAFNPPEGLRKLETLGVPMLGYAIRLVDGRGVDVPNGETGEILIACASRHGLCRGYFNDEEATRALREGQWWHTQDLGSFDADGYLSYTGRLKDMIKRSGFNVAAAEIERVLDDHPDVHESAVIGVPDDIRDEAIKALIVLRPGARLDERELRARCERELADYKVPQFFEAVEELPKTPAGKIDKRAVKELHATQLVTGSHTTPAKGE